MAILYIREYGISAKSSSAANLSVGVEPAVYGHRIGLSGSITWSGAFSDKTSFVRVWASCDAVLKFASDAASFDEEDRLVVPIASRRWEQFGVRPGDRCAAIRMPQDFLADVDPQESLLCSIDRSLTRLVNMSLEMLGERKAEDFDG